MKHRISGARPGAALVETGMRLGSYEILLCIGRGGMASVWAARQHGARGFSRLVALKTILPELAAPDLDGMFLDEARVTARIHHPNVCEVFELIEHGGVLALSMEWVDGDTLHNVIQNVIQSRPKNPALDPRVAAQIIAQVAYGLHAAHELKDDRGAPLQLVHRDVSPQNILISRTGHVKVTDFGVAKSLGGVREATTIGKVKGKLSYMSPEQAQGEVIDRRSDIFSLGVVLYLATVGSHPFRRSGESRHQQLSRLLTNRLKRPSDVVKGYPAQLESIVLRALNNHPAERFASADEMARALQDWMLSSGPLVTDHQIAQMMLELAGASILERSERIANLMCAAPEGPSANEQEPAALDPTLVPTTSRARQSNAPGRALHRTTLRTVSTTLTAGAIALAASFVFTTPSTPSTALAGHGGESVPAAGAPAAVAPPAPAAPEPSGNGASHAALTAPSGPAGVNPGATAQRSASIRATAAARARPRARKPSTAVRQRASRQNGPLAIRRGR